MSRRSTAGVDGVVQQAARSTGPLAVVVGVLLVSFVVVVAREVGANLGAWPPGRGDPYELFAVSLTGLVGGVFAVVLGTGPRTRGAAGGSRLERLRARLATVYAVTYALAGGAALVVCLVRLGDSTALLRGLAATFLGTAVAAASTLFEVETR